jgi:Domian of unknown function (DUF4952)
MNHLIIGIFLFSLSCSNLKKDDCNLLAAYAEQPKNLDLVECKKGEGQTIKYSTYKVKGKHSLELEKYFVENYGMGKLKFTCCGWEPIDGKEGEINNSELKKLNNDYHLLITMTGSAEKKNDKDSLYIEKDRNKIDYFKVTVRLVEI